MRRILLQLIVTVLLPFMATAQSDIAPRAGSNSIHHALRTGPGSGTNTTNALFDLEWNYTLGAAGFAGVTWTNGDFWVSKWAANTLYTVNKSTGALSPSFVIAGIDSIRGMTFDGHYVWAVDNSTTVYKIDTATRAIVGTFAAPLASRGIAWDSTANGGAGGFWLNNYGTDIVQVDTLGNQLNALLAGDHGLTSMYSIAFDPYTSGGPYIWAFNQGTTNPPGKFLYRIPVATGIPNLMHDVSVDIPLGSAGGLTITNFAHPGPHSIVCVLQAPSVPAGTPSRLISYELSDYVPPAYDASADVINFSPATTKTPSFLSNPVIWDITATNNGGTQLDSLGVDLTVNDGTSNVFNATGYSFGVPTTIQASVSIPGSFTPDTIPGSNYSVSALINTGVLQADIIPTNDTLAYDFSITDTVMSTYGPLTSGIGLPDTTDGNIGQLFDIPTTCYATSLTFRLLNPVEGDSIYGELFDWNGTEPNVVVARTTGYTFTAADVNGVVVTLPLQGGPLLITPASYVAAIHQTFWNVSIAYSTFNWRPNTCWVFFTGGTGWVPSENLVGNLKLAPFIDLNVKSQSNISVEEINNSVLSVYPNPASGEINVVNPLSDKCKFTITDMQGQIVFSKTFQGKQKEVIRTSEWSNGIYVAKIESQGKNIVSKVVVNH